MYCAVANRMISENGMISSLCMKHKNEKVETKAVLDGITIAGRKCGFVFVCS